MDAPARHDLLPHADAPPTAELAALARKQPLLHLAIALGHYACLVGAAVLVARARSPLLAAAAIVWEGGLLFGCTILLHEVTHENCFATRRPRLGALLAFLYACPVGIAPSQFIRWHLDHHRHLGDDADDPKRAHLSPKRNRRWVKLGYFTPLLFPIYFRAAARAARGYDEHTRRIIGRERLGVIALHLVGIAALLAASGPSGLLRVYVLPLFVVFPAVFALNRLGQHYAIDDRGPLTEGTRVDGNPLWRWLFLWSNHHLEHHLYPDVPFYRLTRLNRLLRPRFAAHGWPSRGYCWLMHQWFWRNRAAHTRWDDPR